MKLYFFAAHTVKSWARSVLDKQESQTGFLLRNDSSSEYNNFTSVRLLFPMNDDSLTVQRLRSEMPRSEPPSQILTHILTFPPVRVSPPSHSCRWLGSRAQTLVENEALAI